MYGHWVGECYRFFNKPYITLLYLMENYSQKYILFINPNLSMPCLINYFFLKYIKEQQSIITLRVIFFSLKVTVP